MTANRRNNLDELRVRARRSLELGRSGFAEGAPTLQQLVEDLSTYQVELELQNEQLRCAHEEASAALAQYQVLFDGMPLPAVVISHRDLVTQANPRALALFGDVNGAGLNRSVLRVLDEASQATLLEALHAPPSDEPRVLPRLIICRRDGTRVPTEAHLISLSQDPEAEARALVVFVDRTCAETQDRERRLFQALLDNSSALMFAFDRQGRCLLANDALLRQLGRRREQVIGFTREAWLQRDDAQAHRDHDLKVLATGQPQLTEETVHGEAGERVFISQKFPLRDPGGAVIGIGGVNSDISELRQQEVRLQLASRAFSQGSEAIMITDAENRIISVNPAFETVTLYSEAEVLGRKPSVLSSGRHGPEFFEQLWKTLNATNRWEGEIWNRRKSGEEYPEWLSLSRVLDSSGHLTHHVAVFSDISRRKFAEAEVERLAYFDTLTGAPNRNLLRDRIEQAIRAAQRSDGQFVVMFLDLDRFKEINDTLGHDVGDLLLIELARRLRGAVREEDTVSRLGGDEFVVVLPGAGQDIAQRCSERILTAVLAPYVLNGHTLRVTASIGMAVYPDDGADAQALLKNADTSMYQAKSDGRNGARFFSADMAARVAKRAALTTALRNAIPAGEFRLAFQPQVDLADGRVRGVEALLRWNHAALGNPGPAEFIPVAEESGLILPISQWVLGAALRQAKEWRARGLPPFRLAVNLAASHFGQADLASQILSGLAEANWPGELLELEITERVAIKNLAQSIEIMNRLKAEGVHFALDDFGTGYSSLASLRELPIDTLKIDKSFLPALGSDGRNEAVVGSVIALAHTLRHRVVAEGVETTDQAEFLRGVGCQVAQGYLFARPMWGEDVEGWLAARR